ncbi:MAG: ribonuclease III [Rickettsiales bacterium]|jgi:ribonuclease-3|nr:ribonuclease III [Rickettsiales bacterium]
MGIDYKFNNMDLYELALTQSGANAKNNNERLEFIGDRVLGLSVAAMLYEIFGNEREGDLARRHAVLVSTDTLANVAKSLGLDTKIRHGHMTGGRKNHMIANAMEAVIGAIFLDGGFDAARNFIVKIWGDLATSDLTPPKDAKTALQEFVQKNNSGALPEYTAYTEKNGFRVSVIAMGKSAFGNGATKKEASINAAEKLLQELQS